MGIKRRQFLASMGSLAGLAALPVSAASAAGRRPNTRDAVPLYKNASAPIGARVEDLLTRMTLDEKIMQMQCIWQKKADIQDAATNFSAAKASATYPHSIGMIARPSDREGTPKKILRTARETAEYLNAWKKWAIGQTGHCIPV